MGDAQGKLEFTPNISESSITQWLLSPRADPRCLFHVDCLALGTGSRSLLSRQQGDLEQDVLSLTKAIYLPHTQDTSSSLPNIVQIFYYLALEVFLHVMESRRSEDVECCIRYFRYLHEQLHEFSMKFPLPVTTVLVHSLAVHIELELGDVDQDIKEMADLCDELLNSDLSIQSLTRPIADFARAVRFYSCKDIPKWKNLSEKVMDCLRKATVRLPGLHRVSILLAESLYNRFVVTPSDDDYKEGMVSLDKTLMFRGSGDEPSPFRVEELKLAAMFANARFDAYGKPEHLEHAIYRFRTLLDGTSLEDPDRARIIKRLSDLERLRFNGTANSQDALSISSDFLKLPSFHDLIDTLPEAMADKPNLMKTLRKHVDGFLYQPAY